MDPARLAWTDESLLRCRSDDSAQNSRIWIGAESSKYDAMVDSGLASLLAVSSEQRNASADSQGTVFSSLCVLVVPRFRSAVTLRSWRSLGAWCDTVFINVSRGFCHFSPRHHGERSFDGLWLPDATCASGARWCEDQRDRVAANGGGLRRAVAGNQGWAALGCSLWTTRPLAQGEEGPCCSSQAGNSSAVKTRKTPETSHARRHSHTSKKRSLFFHCAGIGRVIFRPLAAQT